MPVGAEDFDSSGIDPPRVRNTQKAWVSLITTCKSSALKNVQSAESPSEAWHKLDNY